MQILESQTKLCPFCAELIPEPAIKCRFCSEILDVKKAKAIQSGSDPNAAQSPDGSAAFGFDAKPSLWAMSGSAIRAAFFLVLAVILIAWPLENSSLFELQQDAAFRFAAYRILAGVAVFIIVALLLFLKALSLKMMHYRVSDDRIEFSRGVFDRKIDNIDMFRVIDLKMRRSLFDCIVGIGTVSLVTTDKSDPDFTFEKIKNPRRLYDIIKQASLKADQKQGVIHVE
jgi:membrane protein YdbS with pleckstrin-like domain